MVMMGSFDSFLAVISSPMEGVRPPWNRQEFSSTRSAPPFSAWSTSSTLPQQTSSV